MNSSIGLKHSSSQSASRSVSGLKLADELVKLHTLFSNGDEMIRYFKFVDERDPKLEDPHLVYRRMRIFYRKNGAESYSKSYDYYSDLDQSYLTIQLKDYCIS